MEITTIVAYPTLRYSKTCITLKRKLRFDWKFGNKLILSISTELCHKSIMIELQNGSSNNKSQKVGLKMHAHGQKKGQTSPQKILSQWMDVILKMVRNKISGTNLTDEGSNEKGLKLGGAALVCTKKYCATRR